MGLGDSKEPDQHLPIGDGQINFKPIFEKLKEINYSGVVTLELYDADEESRRISLQRVRELI
ncbi:MAG: sugar phosphate isomerase/epimerase family protein [Candidatus Hodarchaeota archaeon]